MSSASIDSESRLEGLLVSEISLLDPDLLVMGTRMRTSFGGEIDILSPIEPATP